MKRLSFAPWAALLGLLLAAPCAARQEPPPAAAADERSRELAEEIRLLRFLSQTRLNRDVLEKLLAILERGQRQLREGDKVSAVELARRREALRSAKTSVIAGRNLDGPGPEEVAVATTRARLETQRAGFLAQLGQGVRAILENALSPEQRAAALAAAAEFVRERRAAVTAPAFFGGFGGGAAMAQREMDGLRSAGPEEYGAARMRFALRSANVPGWWATPGVFGPRIPGGPGLPEPGARGPIVFGGGPGGANITPPNLNDPAIQARIRPFLALADRVRGMPGNTYRQSRDDLAKQVDRARQQARVDAPIPDEEAMEALVQAFLRPRMVPVLQAKLGKA